jgi:hypothetical protein
VPSRIVGYCSEMLTLARKRQGFQSDTRSPLLPRLNINARYSFINRNIAYDFESLNDVSAVKYTSAFFLRCPKAVATAGYRFFHQIRGL